MSTPILVVGFNRLDKLIFILETITNWAVPHIYISIDGPKDESTKDITKNITMYLQKFNDSQKYTIWINETNLGISRNISDAISRILLAEETLIVVEDDVVLNENVFLSIGKILHSHSHAKLGLVGGFSAIPAPPKIFTKLIRNKFRPSLRLNVWGWGVTRTAWELYERDLSKIDLEKVLSASKSWNKLSSKQKNIWMKRFKKVANDPNYTWDFQLQFMTFRYDLQNYLPRFRAVDNTGFDSALSTNTKNKKPKTYLGRTDPRNIDEIDKNPFVIWLLTKLELWTDSRPSITRLVKKFKI
jgi:hypothetical protein